MEKLKTWTTALILGLWLPLNSWSQGSDCDQWLNPEAFPEFFNPLIDRHGFVTDAYPLTLESVFTAHSLGILPWSLNDKQNALWDDLPERGVLFFDHLHLPKNDRKFLQRFLRDPGPYRVTFDHAFEDVMRECMTMNRRDQGIWLTSGFLKPWQDLQERGLAHSVEVWNQDQLVAGLYGVFVQGVFSGDSMFHKESNVAKLALFALVERLKASGHTWMDTQRVYGLVESWGASTLPRDEYQKLLRERQKRPLPF